MLNGFPNPFQATIPAMQPGRITTFHYWNVPPTENLANSLIVYQHPTTTQADPLT